MSAEQIAARFRLDGSPVYCERYGSGHINDTYLVVTGKNREYILQKINKFVFKEPEAVMRNIAAVTRFLRDSCVSGGSVLALVPTYEDTDYYVDGEGEYWRVYDYIAGSLNLDRAESPADFYESGAAFGRFQQALSDFDASTLTETIPRFHDTPNRFTQLKEAVAKDAKNRVKDAGPEIAFALAREEYAATLVRLQKDGILPLRVTHNDTKLNNVLFNADRKAICVIDLDTVMPGLAVNDFGDSIRFGASTAAEDEPDLSKVSLSLEMYEAYTRGFLQSGGLTDAEREHLRDGAKMMTLECGVRFLTDYINGDVYFHTAREGHNMDRCRTQFKLVEDMERKWEDMERIVAEVRR
ncbi:MAG: aminoglycoside phosphotransferase family protein [Defluviitaleaceae bacterium]|nr:aminoglycoside phosphotransferase family protein [Defluviitaleaceae bacterium]MCL2835544.1 aminoglycoside phosphotransferase family protein [Defluviitaleaceae bacterium]